MDKKYEAGEAVVFVDENGVVHNALATRFHYGYESITKHKELHGEPCINLVYTSPDMAKQDSYGQQIERRSSVPHKSHQWVNGMFWKWPGEVI